MQREDTAGKVNIRIGRDRRSLEGKVRAKAGTLRHRRRSRRPGKIEDAISHQILPRTCGGGEVRRGCIQVCQRMEGSAFLHDDTFRRNQVHGGILADLQRVPTDGDGVSTDFKETRHRPHHANHRSVGAIVHQHSRSSDADSAACLVEPANLPRTQRQCTRIGKRPGAIEIQRTVAQQRQRRSVLQVIQHRAAKHQPRRWLQGTRIRQLHTDLPAAETDRVGSQGGIGRQRRRVCGVQNQARADQRDT